MTNTEHGMLSSRYRLLERLATGGMGEIWRAEDELLGRDVAIKILKDEYAGDESFRIRFRAEARNTAGLSHPGIAQMYDYGEEEDVAYLVMELVPGQPLSEILYRNERLSPEVTLEIIAQAARALQAAHDADLIHRDIKPGNLIVDPDGQVKVTDFGIARVVNAATMTQTGTVLGTAQYVSPEQAEGRPLTPATDVYSLGIVAYECLTGQTPFTGESAVAIALAHVRDKPPALPEDVPAGVRDLIGRCLSKDPEHRPPSAGELSNIAYMARESLRMGDAGPETAVASSAGMAGAGVAGAGVAGAVSAEREDGIAAHAEAETPLQESSPASGEATAAEDETGGHGATPPFGMLGVAGAAAEAGSVTTLDAAPQASLDEPETAGGVPYRRRVLIIAGAMSVAVICAGALMLGFRWDALFNPAGYPNEGNVPPAVPDSTSPSWRLSPGWDTSDPSQRTQRGGAGVPGGPNTGGETTADPDDDNNGDGDGPGDGPKPDPSDTPGPGGSNTATDSPTTPTGGPTPTDPTPSETNGGGDGDDKGDTGSPSSE